MAVAWIVWRELQQVRENCAGFRKECTQWMEKNNQNNSNGT